MDLKALLEKMDQFAGQAVGQKPGDQWRGSDKAPPGKKLVGDSILKDLSKGKTPKSKEQELSEEFQAFLEAEFKDTVDKRPARKNARPTRGHEPQSGYKTVKADEGYDTRDAYELEDPKHPDFVKNYEAYKAKHPNAKLADFIAYLRSRKTKTNEALGQQYTVVIDRKGREKPVTGTMEELLDYFGYTLETGKSYEHEKGRYKINLNPKNAEQLVDALNKAATNAAANSSPSTHYSVGQTELAESHYKWEITFKNGKKAVYHHDSPNYSDATAASDIQYHLKSNPGATVVATKDDKPFDWQSLSEGWESGPEEYKEPYDDADDAYDRMRQEKIDTEVEREWAKLPKVSTYKLTGRGPNMEPNYEFGDEFDSMEKALKYREEIMKDPKTPYPEHIGIRTITRVVKENSATTPKNPEHAKQMMKDLGKLQTEIPNPDPELQATMARRKDILMKQAKELGIDESRAHKVLDTWFKNRELQDKFARGEVKIPTPQERKAELEKSKEKKQVKELVNTPPQGTATQTMQQKTQAQDPKQAQAVAQATQAMKSATGSSAPATTLAKALDTASQGKPVMGQEAAALQPLMKDMATVAQDPKIAGGTFKSLVNQINQAQIRQK